MDTETESAGVAGVATVATVATVAAAVRPCTDGARPAWIWWAAR